MWPFRGREAPPLDLSERLAQWCLALVSIESVYGNEDELADALWQWGKRVFPNHAIRSGNNLVLGDLTDRRPTIALVGHLDTVPPAEGHIPSPRIDGDRVVGLGSTDMKAGLAVMCALAEAGRHHETANNLVLVLYDKEEGPHEANGLGGLLAQPIGLDQVALGICMEPTDNAVQLGCVGSLHATVTFAGRAAHSARPWLGENAIHKAARLLTALASRPPVEVAVGELTFREVLSATLAEGGIGRTTVPDRFELNLNYRFAPGKSLLTAEREVAALVGGDGQVQITDRSPSGAVSWDNPLVEALVELTGGPPEPKQAWTDVARLTEAGIDAVNYGPGDPEKAHQVGEYASTQKMVRAYQTLWTLLERD